MRVLSNGGGVNVHNWARVQSNTIGFSDINVFCFEGCLVADNNISNGRIGINITSGTIVRNSIINHVLHGITGTSASAGGAVGYGENTLVGNNQGGAQVRNATALNPNFCSPMCKRVQLDGGAEQFADGTGERCFALTGSGLSTLFRKHNCHYPLRDGSIGGIVQGLVVGVDFEE
jgi:hypothetical protein